MTIAALFCCRWMERVFLSVMFPTVGLWLYYMYVSSCYVRIDPRPGWEPCFLPARLINGVVVAIGRNEGTKRRRSASWPGTHTLSSTEEISHFAPRTRRPGYSSFIRSFSHLCSFFFITSSPLTFLCSSSLFLSIVGPFASPSSYHLHLYHPPLALPDVTP